MAACWFSNEYVDVPLKCVLSNKKCVIRAVFWIALQSDVCGWKKRDAEIAGERSWSQTKNFKI